MRPSCVQSPLTFSAGLAVILLGAVSPPGLLGQESRTVGIHVGRVRSELLWDGPNGTRRIDGVRVGMDLQVQTPIPYLSIRPELGYVQRGTVVQNEVADPENPARARARSHYISVSILGELGRQIRSASMFLLGGFSVDQLLETECSADLCQLLFDEQPSVLGVTAGIGASVAMGNGLEGQLEVRLAEGLTDAYRMTRFGARYRSLEAIVRLGVPF